MQVNVFLFVFLIELLGLFWVMMFLNFSFPYRRFSLWIWPCWSVCTSCFVSSDHSTISSSTAPLFIPLTSSCTVFCFQVNTLLSVSFFPLFYRFELLLKLVPVGLNVSVHRSTSASGVCVSGKIPGGGSSCHLPEVRNKITFKNS